ncbi:MAG: ATP-binding protein [Archangium sp.]|nr:ATP-binding protein [Archangium sp.]
MALDLRILPLEKALQTLSKDGTSRRVQLEAELALRDLLVSLAPQAASTCSMSELIENASHGGNLRLLALVLLRALPFDGLLSTNPQDALIQIRTLEAIEKGAPDIFRQHIGSGRQQTFEKLESLRKVHSGTTDRLGLLTGLPVMHGPLLSLRRDILHAINAKTVSAYLAPFGGTELASNAEALLLGLQDLKDVVGHSFGPRLQQLRDTIQSQQDWAFKHPTFLTEGFYRPFLISFAAATAALDHESRERFKCTLDARSRTLEKRYLLDENRITTITIPLINHGPGIAFAVSATVTSEAAALSVTTFHIGDIQPGDFALTVALVPSKNLHSLRLDIALEWEVPGVTAKSKANTDVTVNAQSTGIDWSQLSLKDPYNSNIAEGADFVGRREKLSALTSRLSKDRMQSSYITGQKRVGKSSLAMAVMSKLNSATTRFLYLEYGEFAHTEPTRTLKALAHKISDFLATSLPQGFSVGELDFQGTLAPITVLADHLLRLTPATKFIIVIDEFDEIPAELYRVGPLAETFFSNIRTISGKKNMAFVLVGGENMPFIVAAQGDQMNKFVRESLNYFSRIDEWEDFTQLVHAPVAKTGLSWHDSAINAVFDMTLGHPYYAKLLCSRVYSRAISEKDGDITAAEVVRAYTQLVSDLDVNSFAHLWKDGVQGSREEVEAVGMRRCRLLVAMGRLMRAGIELKREAVIEAAGSVGLVKHEILPILTDFCRRGVLEDNGESYEFLVPLFRDWTKQSGINRLITDDLGTELAESAQRAEDKAFVNDGEIADVVNQWTAYRGRTLSVPDVRLWLEQFGAFSRQRLAFKLLQQLRFVSEQEIREKLRLAHSLVLKSIPEFVRKSRADRRQDVVVTYIDGPAKSGQYYASRYAEENFIASSAVLEISGFEKGLERLETTSGHSANGLVIVDDFVGTGRSLTGNLEKFLERERATILSRSMSVVVVVLAATPEGERHLRAGLATLGVPKVDLRVCEPLGPSHFAFAEKNGNWLDEGERARAKAMCIELGVQLARDSPLGFGDQGLLLVFPQTCPNNTLPVLHAEKRGHWRPLFPRPKN